MGKRSSSSNSSAEKSDDNKDIDSDLLAQIEDDTKHHCTDCCFLLLFFVFWLGMLAVGITAFEKGDPRLLTHGQDMYGNVCGFENFLNDDGFNTSNRDLTDFPLLIYPRVFYGDFSWSYCVAECPTINFDEFESLLAIPGDQYLCPYPSNGSAPPFPESLDEKFFALVDEVCFFPYPTVEVVGRCLPDVEQLTGVELIPPRNDSVNASATSFTSAYSSFYGNGSIEEPGGAGDFVQEVSTVILADFYTARFIILACAGIALALSFLWIIVLYFFAQVLVWITLFLVLAIFMLLTIVFGLQWQGLEDDFAQYEATNRTDQITDGERAQKTLMFTLTCIGAVATLAYICLVLFFRTAIRLAIDIIEVSAKALQHVWTIIFLPIVTLVLLLCVYFWFLIVWLFLGTAGTMVQDPEGNFKGYKSDRTLQGMQLYHVFGLFWSSSFIMALGELTIAAAVKRWYYAPKEKKGDALLKPLHFSLYHGLVVAFWYHAGTAAFGSLIVAIVKMIRYVLGQVQRATQGSKNVYIQKVYACLQCFFACLEKVLKFINRNAYIIVAVEGDMSFCEACKFAFKLLLSNARNLVAVQVVSTFLLVMGKVFVVFLTTIVAVFWCISNEDLRLWGLPVLLVIVVSYYICSGFTGLFEMCIDTIFLCVARDIEYSQFSDLHTPEKALWVPDDLVEYLKKRKATGPADGGAPAAIPAPKK